MIVSFYIVVEIIRGSSAKRKSKKPEKAGARLEPAKGATNEFEKEN